MKNKIHGNLKPRIIDQITRTANWVVRILLAVLLGFSVWPYLPKNYSHNGVPDKNFPVLVSGTGNTPEIISFADWGTTDPRPFLWKDKGSGKAMMRSMAFSYNVDIEQSGIIRIKLKRSDEDHMVSADYRIDNDVMTPVSYHSMDPGIAFVLILWLIAWGVLVIVRKTVIGILGRILKG